MAHTPYIDNPELIHESSSSTPDCGRHPAGQCDPASSPGAGPSFPRAPGLLTLPVAEGPLPDQPVPPSHPGYAGQAFYFGPHGPATPMPTPAGAQ